ncbi:hypothetical protein BDV93DRAFT_612162 [Ceratobasidium sp. AG-I]|nr:hypothetical protein BDV93DRAFT_612162 [Ceratobasidium sp. AG-I]
MTTICTPPKLPVYLAGTFDLKPVTGIPSDSEVMLIHAAIRGVNDVFHVPALCDPDLSMRLAQHLFNVQMEKYRERYPVNVLPHANVYDPPVLPSHVNVPLKSVTGAPSDDEIKSVHSALRVSESLTNVPSLYDPELSMSLSQHLFDIQFARYIKQTTKGYYAPHNTSDDAGDKQETKLPHQPVVSTEQPEALKDHETGSHGQAAPHSHHRTGSNPGIGQKDGLSSQVPHCSASDSLSRIAALLEKTQEVTEQMGVGQNQTNQLLVGMQDTLKDGIENVTRMMIKLHNHSARGFNSGHDYIYHHIVSENGEAPLSCEVPAILTGRGQTFWKASDSLLAQYLQFYNIGTELIEKGNPPTLKPSSNERASRILGEYTHSRGY